MVTKSKVPPVVLAKIDRLNTSDSKVYIQDLISDYALKMEHLDHYAKRQIERWAKGQRAFLEDVITELQAILDSK